MQIAIILVCFVSNVSAGGGLEKLLLEMIICGRLQNESAVMEFIDCTLMRVQQEATAVSSFLSENCMYAYEYCMCARAYLDLALFFHAILIGAGLHEGSTDISEERTVRTGVE